MKRAQRFLIVNTANIGDLLVSTPAIRLLRQQFPRAQIDAFVNSYNAPVLDNNPDINHVYFYTKAKHRKINESVWKVHFERLCTLLRLRRARYDYIILAGNGFSFRPYRLALLIGSKHLIGFRPNNCMPYGMDFAIELRDLDRHEVVKMLDLIESLGVDISQPPGLVLQPACHVAQDARNALSKINHDGTSFIVAVHISARLPSQRWSSASFAELIKQLHKEMNCRFMLFWSPGGEAEPGHPGDDEKAAEIINQCRGIPLLAYPTKELKELIGALSVCQAMFCSDGGAMHIGAALGLPIVSLFGDSSSANWRPWGVPYLVLQPLSRNVEDISVEEALLGCKKLFLENISIE